MIVSIDVDAQKTFTPLCPKELPVAEGHLIVDELNAQAALADLRVMTKDAHHTAAKWLVDNPIDMLKSTGLPDADLTWVSHAMVGTYGYELLDGLPSAKEYDYCVYYRFDRMVALSKCRYSHCRRFGNGLLCENDGFTIA